MQQPYLSAGRKTVLVLEFAHKWAKVSDMPVAQGEASSEMYSFRLFEREYPQLAALAKRIQFETFDHANAIEGA